MNIINIKNKFFILLIFLFFSLGTSLNSWALTGSLGTGYSGAFSGRRVPIIYGAVQTDDWALTGYSSGVKSSLSYHSAFQLNMYMQKNFGDVFWGKLSGGIGLGGFYAQRGYRTSSQLVAEKAHDYDVGPAIKASWNVFAPLYFTVESLFGVRNLYWLVNSYQQVTTIVLELRLP